MLVKICLGLSRPYPLKVSGREISYKYVPDRKYFSMKFVPADDSGTLSEIIKKFKISFTKLFEYTFSLTVWCPIL